jgi:putative membrane protein
MDILINLLVSGLSVFLADYLLAGIKVSSFIQAIMVGIILGIVNTIIRPIILFFTLPLNLVTFGLFTFVVNALMVLLVAKVVPDFYVANFWWALAFSVVVSLISTFLSGLKNN